MRVTFASLATLVSLVAFCTPATAASSAGPSAFFLRGESLEPAPRSVRGVRPVILALLRGPTAAERARGLRSAVPAGTPLLGLTIERRVVTVDLGERFLGGRDSERIRSRVAQLVRTVTSVPGVLGVRIRVAGGVPVGFAPGLDLRRPLRATDVADVGPPSIRDVQLLLADLGFMARGGVDGALDDRTAVAILAFEKWAGLPRDGALDPLVTARLMRATRPVPVIRAPGRRIEVQLGRQLAMLIENDRVERVVHISSGAWGTPTPLGSYAVYRKERMSWSVPFSVWMPWASYFTGGIALHQAPSVPPYPASHGCVRVNVYDAPYLYEFAVHGTPVRVLST